MISFKPYLFGERDGDADSAYRRIIALFLQGMALHAVEGDKADYDRFRGDIDGFAAQIGPTTPMSELLVAVGGALRAMEDYNRRTSKFVGRQNAELQNMVSMLTQTVISIGSSGDASVNKLQEIEKSIEHARMLEDMQLLKLRLGDCLESVRQETLRQRTEGQSALASLQQELDASRDRIGAFAAPVDLDAATGLPAKKEAMKALQAALAAPQDMFLVVAVVSRVQAVNARFGYAVGDRILAAFAEHSKKNLGATDQLFRWHGPAVLALLHRSDRIEKVRTEIRRFADVKLEKTIEVGARTVLLPISASWSVFALEPPLDALLKRLEAFTAAQVPRDLV